MIITKNLSKEFISKNNRITAVENLSIKIPTGSIVGLLGPNGAGKTTTVRMISTLIAPTSGTVMVNGYDLTGNQLKIRESIGLLTESTSMYHRLTARRNLRFYGQLYNLTLPEINKRISELSRKFEIADALDRPVGTFSKGMKQRLSIIKALLHDPPILIFDEPWSGLSPSGIKDLREYIIQLAKDDDKTILICTHNLSQAEKVVDNLFIIKNGKLLTSGSAAHLRKRYLLKPKINFRISNIQEMIPALEKMEQGSLITSFTVLDNDFLQIEIESFDHTPSIVKHLVLENADIHEMMEDVPSLEQVYIELVERR